MENTVIEKEKPTKFQLIVIAIFTVVIIGIITFDIVALITFNVDSNIIMHNPVPGGTYPPAFTAAGYAWDRNSIQEGKDINVTIVLTRISDGKSFSFNAKRSAVRNKGTVLFYLSTFICPVVLDDPGKAVDRQNQTDSGEIEHYTIVARMTTPAGYTLETKPRRIRIDSQAKSREFRFLSAQHIIALLLILIVAVMIVVFFGNNRNTHLRTYAALFLCGAIIVNELAYHIYWYSIGCWSPTQGLMLHMCGIAILFIPYVLFTWKKKIRKYLGELVYFWGLGGALQALLTPDINVHGFPEYKYFSFFISHGLIIICALFIIVIFHMRIRLWAYIRAVVITNITVILVYFINQLLIHVAPFEIANYFVVGYPPPDGSVIDLFVEFFGPSPWYIIGVELMGFAVFALLCIPFLFMKKNPGEIDNGLKSF